MVKATIRIKFIENDLTLFIHDEHGLYIILFRLVKSKVLKFG